MVLLMKTIAFKVSDSEDKLIRSLAKQERTTLSEYLRRKATGVTVPLDTPTRQVCPYTGAMIFAPLPGHVPLTTETVGAMLADFP